MRLEGSSPGGTPALSYIDSPTGTVVGSTKPPVGMLLAIPGQVGPPGSDGDDGEVSLAALTEAMEGKQDKSGRLDGLVSATITPSTAYKLLMTADGGVTWTQHSTYGFGRSLMGTSDAASALSLLELDTIVSDVEAKVPASTQANRIYGTTGTGTQTTRAVSSTAAATSVVVRDANGNTSVADPTTGLHAANKSYVDDKVAAIVNSAPATLDTLDELASALGDDPNFATTTATAIGLRATKATKVQSGTGLTGGGDLSADRTLAVSFGTAEGTVCQGNDSRLTNSRTPTAHTHAISGVTDLQATLDGKAASDLLPVQITQTAYDALGAGRPARLYAIVG